MMNKKAFFFVLDGIFALIILLIGFLIISSSSRVTITEVPLSILSENTMDLLASVNVNELCPEDCECSNQKLEEYCSQGRIRNMNQTLLDYMGELYVLGKKSDSESLFRNITMQNDLLRQDIFGVEFRIDGDVIYHQGGDQKKSNELISVKKIIFSYYELRNNGAVVLWGPYLAEVDIWSK